MKPDTPAKEMGRRRPITVTFTCNYLARELNFEREISDAMYDCSKYGNNIWNTKLKLITVVWQGIP